MHDEALGRQLERTLSPTSDAESAAGQISASLTFLEDLQAIRQLITGRSHPSGVVISRDVLYLDIWSLKVVTRSRKTSLLSASDGLQSYENAVKLHRHLCH